MNVQDLFKAAENGTLTYEQFIEAAKNANAKFVDLSEGAYVDKQRYNDDLSARDTRITDLTSTIATRDDDLSKLRTQLEAAGNDTAKLGQLTTQFEELQSKYTQETADYEQKLKDQAYKFAVNEFANTQEFSSQAAKRDFISSLMAKQLQMENDVLLGANDFVAAYSKENADAFKAKDTNPQPEQPKPHFANATNPASAGGDNTNPFVFNFTGVRPHDKK